MTLRSTTLGSPRVDLRRVTAVLHGAERGYTDGILGVGCGFVAKKVESLL